MSGICWEPDSELQGFEQHVMVLPDAVTYPGEPDEVTATLVRRGEPRHGRAMLYVHGWSDYFFQVHLADVVEAAGFDFYAIDLRRYGRSLQEGQLPGFVTDLGHYYEELGLAADILTGMGHDSLHVMGHSTGGLTAVLWAHDHPERVASVVLNAPWLDLQQAPMLRSALSVLLSAVRSITPTASLPISDTGFYRRSISKPEGGAWEYNLKWKSDPAFVVRAGWLGAVLTGQSRVAGGLNVQAPILMALAERSDFRKQWSEELRRADIVLDVEKLAERAVGLGRHVTVVRIQDGMHDLALSDQPARDVYFDELTRWLAAYG